MQRTLIVVLALLVLTACGPPHIEQPIGSARSADPAELLGVWRVATRDEPANSVLRMDAGGFELSRGEQSVLGSWDASHDTLVADVWGYAGADAGGADWLVGIRPYAVGDGEWHILSDDGARVATMRREPTGEESSSDEAPDLPELGRLARS